MACYIWQYLLSLALDILYIVYIWKMYFVHHRCILLSITNVWHHSWCYLCCYKVPYSLSSLYFFLSRCCRCDKHTRSTLGWVPRRSELCQLSTTSQPSSRPRGRRLYSKHVLHQLWSHVCLRCILWTLYW